jgi:hypothetical protein
VLGERLTTCHCKAPHASKTEAGGQGFDTGLLSHTRRRRRRRRRRIRPRKTRLRTTTRTTSDNNEGYVLHAKSQYRICHKVKLEI